MNTFANFLKRARVGESLVRRNPLIYPKMHSLFTRLSSATLGHRQDIVAQRLSEVLKKAKSTAYGQEFGGELSIDSWPLLSKATVQSAPKNFLRHRHWPAISACTGGTTGEPVTLFRTVSSVAVEQAAIDWAISKLAVRADCARVAILRGDDVKCVSDETPPYWIFANGGRRMVLSSNHLSSRTLSSFVEVLRSFKPDVLWVYPTTLDSLCDLLISCDQRLEIQCVLSSSEVLTPTVWRNAQEVLGCRLLDYYGQAERVAFACATQPGHYSFLPGYAYVELFKSFVDRDFAYYEIVGTPLWNAAMPLVRYRTGDLVQLPHGLSARELLEISYGAREFVGIVGRAGDFLVGPNRTRVVGVDHFQRGVSHLRRLQVVQESLDHVTIFVLASPAFDISSEATLMSNVRAKLPSSISVTILRVDELEKTSSGKTPFVIRRPAVQALFEEAPSLGAT